MMQASANPSYANKNTHGVPTNNQRKTNENNLHVTKPKLPMDFQPHNLPKIVATNTSGKTMYFNILFELKKILDLFLL